MGPLDKYILKDDALSASGEGFQLKFQSHWYRALPLSCMDFKLKINGEAIDSHSVKVEVDGKQYAYADMPDLDKVWLFILDRATLHVPHSKPLTKGEPYTVEFNLDLYPPYILVGPEARPLLAGSVVKKTLVCQ
jgi:Domain of unknown function (DUF6379)